MTNDEYLWIKYQGDLRLLVLQAVRQERLEWEAKRGEQAISEQPEKHDGFWALGHMLDGQCATYGPGNTYWYWVNGQGVKCCIGGKVVSDSNEWKLPLFWVREDWRPHPGPHPFMKGE